MPTKKTLLVLGMAGLLTAGVALAEDSEPEGKTTGGDAGPAASEEGGDGSETASPESGEASAPGSGDDAGEAGGEAGEEAKDKVTEEVEKDTAEPAGDEPEGSVARATFAEGIEEREPVNKLDRLSESAEEVVYFTELKDMAGQTVTHRWIHDGETKAEVDFEVGGPRWRVYSSKDLLPDWTGEWTVEVVDGEERVRKRDTIVFGER